MNNGSFSRETIATLAKRAGQLCSNPTCNAATSGPHSEENKAVNVGEAAHIKGEKPGSKRYDEAMTAAERSAITNGIWLCSRCHSLIDADARRYSVEILYAWKREHETRMIERMGGTLERAVRIRELTALEEESAAAYQIALDQPPFWEFLLTVELVRSKLTPILRHFSDLNRGLIYKPSILLDKAIFANWSIQKMQDLDALGNLLNVAFNEEIVKSWGPLGSAGDPIEIWRAVNYIINACQGAIDWEIEVRFTRFPEPFDNVKQLLHGATESFMREVERLPNEIMETITNPPESGERHIKFVLELPENFHKISEELPKLIPYPYCMTDICSNSVKCTTKG